MLGEKLLEAAGNAAPAANYIEDVFSTYLYTGNGGSQTINNGIDLSTKGGLVWLKARNQAYDNTLIDTVRGNTNNLTSNSTSAQYSVSSPGYITFGSSGFTLPNSGNIVNDTGLTMASWTFRKQPKFFDVVTYTGNGTAGRTVAHSLGSVPGCMFVKRTDTTGTWWVYHKDATIYGLPARFCALQLNSTVAVDQSSVWNETDPTSTTFTVSASADVNANGGTYVAYIFAHNAGGFGLTGTDNVISCGSFTPDGSGNATIDLGFEPQWLLRKTYNNVGDWEIRDSMRGFSMTSSALLYPNGNYAETAGAAATFIPTATGFKYVNGGTQPMIYIAIRRGPMKVPTDATKVFSPNVFAAAAGTQINTGFPVDMQFLFPRDGGFSLKAIDRMRGVNSTTGTVSTPWLATANTAAETNGANTLSWNNTGFQMPTDWQYNLMSFNNFRRAPSFFDEVCYTGSSSSLTLNHNLGVVPELIITKCRSNADSWPVWSQFTSTQVSRMYLYSSGAQSGPFNYSDFAPGCISSQPTNTQVVLQAGNGDSNYNARTFVMYLFATCAGVSKVGSFTGNGSSQTINCGFTGGARFVLIKRTDSAGDWYIYDTARGMTTLTDPYLLLNSTAAESATLGSVTTVTTGFAVNASILAAINTNGASYIFLAIA